MRQSSCAPNKRSNKCSQRFYNGYGQAVQPHLSLLTGLYFHPGNQSKESGQSGRWEDLEEAQGGCNGHQQRIKGYGQLARLGGRTVFHHVSWMLLNSIGRDTDSPSLWLVRKASRIYSSNLPESLDNFYSISQQVATKASKEVKEVEA